MLLYSRNLSIPMFCQQSRKRVAYEHHVVFWYSAVRNPSYSARKVDILFRWRTITWEPRGSIPPRACSAGTHPGTFPPSSLLVMRSARRCSGQHPRMRRAAQSSRLAPGPSFCLIKTDKRTTLG